MNRIIIVSLFTSLIGSACTGLSTTPTGDPANPTTPTNGPEEVEPTAPPAPTQLVYEGTYDTKAQWDLSGPFAGSATVGDVAAEIVVDEVAGLIGVPESMQDAVREKIADAIFDKVRDHVDANAPDALQPDGELFLALSKTFATVEVETRMTLTPDEDDPDALHGTERITAMRVPYDGELHDLPIDQLGLGDDAKLVLEADVTAQVTDTKTLAFDDHSFELRLGSMAGWVMTVLMEFNESPTEEELNDGLVCIALADSITNGDEIELSVLWFDFTLDNSLLEKACDKAYGRLAEKMLGILSFDTGIVLGGEMTAIDADGDQIVDMLSTEGGSYSGVLTMLPGPLDPVVLVSGTSERVETE